MVSLAGVVAGTPASLPSGSNEPGFLTSQQIVTQAASQGSVRGAVKPGGAEDQKEGRDTPTIVLDRLGTAFFAVLALASFGLLVRESLRGDRIVVETHWGGLGGGMSGIRISPALLFLSLAIFFSVLVLVSQMRDVGENAKPSTSEASKGAGTGTAKTAVPARVSESTNK
jgi:hypothetical protein